MASHIVLRTGLGIFTIVLVAAQSLQAAPACKGPNKNDPGCPGAEEPPPPAVAVVDSVTVDWLNQVLVVRGSGFTGSSEFLLGGDTTPLAITNLSDTQLELPFNTEMANEVTRQGNYNLLVDGAIALSIYIEAQIIDPDAVGCPCETDWQTYSWWGTKTTECVEVVGPSLNDIADISGTLLSTPGDYTAYPQYPIGASFYPGAPTDSYCALVEVSGDTTTSSLVNVPINETQQADCATILKDQVCATVTTLP